MLFGFAIWDLRRLQIDKGLQINTEKILLKQICGQKGTSCGRHDNAGWTRHQVHIVPPAKEEAFTIAFSPSPFSICGTRVQQTGEGTAIGEPDPVPPWYYFHRYAPDGSIKKREPPTVK